MRALNLKAFLRDERGTMLPILGAVVVVSIGFAAIAIDMGYLYAMQSRVQSTADAAALAGAGQIPDGNNVLKAAVSLAEKNLPVAANGTVLPKDDVAMGSWDAGTRTFTPAGDPTNAVRILARRSDANANAVELFFAQLLGFEQADVEASAVALRRDISGCIVALDPSADGALTISGNAEVNLGCGALVNSDSPTAIIENGSSCLTATSIATSGDYSGDCLNPTPETSMPPISDPLADLNPPTYSGCDYPDLVEITTNTTLTSGVYCGGIDINSNAVVDFEPGMYILKGLGLQITGNTKVTGDEVTFYFAPDTTGVTGIKIKGVKQPPRSIFIAGTTNVELKAPTSGYYEGILFYQDRNAPSNMNNLFTGGATMNLEGMFYFPNTEVKFAGNSAVNGSNWIGIVARTVEFVGTTDLFQDLSQVAYSPGAIFVTLSLVD